jgi:hypothetical protein
MTKHGTKSSQKAEMTPQELADKYEYGYRDFKEVFLSDLRSVLRGELIREADELKKQNPYPESVFIPIEAETLRKVIKYLKQGGYSPDALFGHWGRTVWNNCVERLKENNNQ